MENGKYADYAYYTKYYIGTEITAEKFGPNILLASALIDRLTFGRLKRLEAVPDEVRNAACAAAECLYRHAERSGREIASESNDGYSVSYVYTNGDAQKEAISDATTAIRTFLAPTGLLYRGFSRKYDLIKDGDVP